VAALHELVSAGNELLLPAERGDAAAQAAVAGLADTLVDLGDAVLGLHLEAALSDAAGLEGQLSVLVESLLEGRATARAEKDFATADAIRDQLTAAGIVVEDRPDGARWYVANAGGGHATTA